MTVNYIIKGRLGNAIFRYMACVIMCIHTNKDYSIYNRGNITVTDEMFYKLSQSLLKKEEINIKGDSFNMTEYYQHDSIYKKFRLKIFNFINSNHNHLVITDGVTAGDNKCETFKMFDILNTPINFKKIYKNVIHLRLEDFVTHNLYLPVERILNLLNKNIIIDSICIVCKKTTTEFEDNYIKTILDFLKEKNIDVKIPLNMLTVVTGVSGSGKSTLIKDILYPALQKKINNYGEKAGQFTEIIGDIEGIKSIEFVDQNPIGRSSRSNPITYIKAYDDIRALFTGQKLARTRGFKAKHFSFNVDGGRCETCKGEGDVTIEMQFMADVHLECETCKGRRFKKEVLEVLFEGKSIYDILETTVDEAILFFEKYKQPKIVNRLKPLQDVGLGYVHLGQASSTLSGGEAQRIKLASFLVKGYTNDKTLFIFDEPTTGLHFHDINKLLTSFNALIEKGHSIIVIEHNMELIKCADYIIDLGQEGGENGGNVIVQGPPEEIINNELSYTAKYLREKII